MVTHYIMLYISYIFVYMKRSQETPYNPLVLR